MYFIDSCQETGYCIAESSIKNSPLNRGSIVLFFFFPKIRFWHNHISHIPYSSISTSNSISSDDSDSDDDSYDNNSDGAVNSESNSVKIIELGKD